MEEDNKTFLWFVGGLIILVVFLAWRERSAAKAADAVVKAPPAPDFYSPYYWPGGSFPTAVSYSGAVNPHDSTINVYVDNPALALLNANYIPIFGLVGMTAVGGAA